MCTFEMQRRASVSEGAALSKKSGQPIKSARDSGEPLGDRIAVIIARAPGGEAAQVRLDHGCDAMYRRRVRRQHDPVDQHPEKAAGLFDEIWITR